jgi:hypothetical protein
MRTSRHHPCTARPRKATAAAPSWWQRYTRGERRALAGPLQGGAPHPRQQCISSQAAGRSVECSKQRCMHVWDAPALCACAGAGRATWLVRPAHRCPGVTRGRAASGMRIDTRAATPARTRAGASAAGVGAAGCMAPTNTQLPPAGLACQVHTHLEKVLEQLLHVAATPSSHGRH